MIFSCLVVVVMSANVPVKTPKMAKASGTEPSDFYTNVDDQESVLSTGKYRCLVCIILNALSFCPEKNNTIFSGARACYFRCPRPGRYCSCIWKYCTCFTPGDCYCHN